MRLALSAALLFVLLGAACSGRGVTGTAAPQVILEGHFDTQANSDCTVQGALVSLGKFTDPPVAVVDGTPSNVGTTHVTCRITTSGGSRESFEVEGTIHADDRVLFSIRGTFPTVPGIQGFDVDAVTMSTGDPGNYSAFTQADKKCHVVYAGSGKQGVEIGRVWAEVTCPTAMRDPISTGDGMGTCAAIAQFRFENCDRGQ